MKRMFIYIAGPYTRDDVALNVRRAIEVGDKVLKLGFIPYIPHLSHFWHMLLPHCRADWLALDFAWLAKCDYLIRLAGISDGANAEVQQARSLGITVFYGLADFELWIEKGMPERGIR